MTVIEEKVDKLVNKIDDLRDKGFDDTSILLSVRNYLLGLIDGIDFAKEMHEIKG